MYLLPQNQNTKTNPKQVEHLVYMLERTLDIAPPGQESLALLIDFRNSSAGSQPSIGTARQVMSILQGHYPERLGRALITHCESTLHPYLFPPNQLGTKPQKYRLTNVERQCPGT